MEQFDIIYYHKNCPDGIGGLWVANHSNKIPIHYPLPAGENPILEEMENKRIIFVDVCPKPNFILQTIKKCNKMVILDHHKSSKEMVEDIMKKKFSNLEIIFDMERSGAKIAWDYFFPKTPCPFFINYIEDKDLWKWKLPYSREINFALESYLNIEKLTYFFKNEEESFQKLLKEGKIKKENNDKKIQKIAECSVQEYFIFKGNIYKVRKIYNISNRRLTSDVGNYLCEQYSDIDFAIITSRSSSYNSYSLRGIKGKCPDLSLIAKEYGGGGHLSSAGMRISNEQERYFSSMGNNLRKVISSKLSESIPSKNNKTMEDCRTPMNSPVLKR